MANSIVFTAVIEDVTEGVMKSRPTKYLRCKLSTGHFIHITHPLQVEVLRNYLGYLGVSCVDNKSAETVVQMVKIMKVPLHIRYKLRLYDEQYYMELTLMPHNTDKKCEKVCPSEGAKATTTPQIVT